MARKVKIQAGDWVFMKGGGKRLWVVTEIYDDKWNKGRFGATLHDGWGMGGANMKISEVRKIASQRELLASENFKIGYQRWLRDHGELVVKNDR
jgi:hypothetical protein